MVSSVLVVVLTSSAIGGDGAVTHIHVEQLHSLLHMNGLTDELELNSTPISY
jgi:hypothetical protein